MTVLIDPFERYEDEKKELSKAGTEKAGKSDGDDHWSPEIKKGKWFSGPSSVDEMGGVGKYLRRALENKINSD